MNSMNRIVPLVVASIFSLTCFAQSKTSVEIQAIQTRTYDGTEKEIFRAVLSTLQNNGYEEIRSDSGAGLISARLPAVAAGDTPEEQAAKTAGSMILGMIIPFGGLMVQSPKTGEKTRSATITVEQLTSKRTQVRVALKETEQLTQYGAFGTVNRETKENDLTDKPEVYQLVFEQIDKEIFVRKNR